MNNLENAQIHSQQTPQQSKNDGIYREVLSGLKDSPDPLEFIRSNIRTNVETSQIPQISPNQMIPQGSQIVPRPQPETPPETIPETSATQQVSFRDEETGLELPLEPQKKVEAEKSEATPPEQVEQQPDELAKGPEESIKNLRKKTNELKTQLQDKEKTLGELQEELERYKKGETIPEVLKEKEDRISQLEYYERLHALRLSPEYQEKYVTPSNALRDKALKIAQDYQVDPEVLNEAYELENKRDLNSFLRNHFDDVGTLEIRDVLLEMRRINEEAKTAEQEPAKTLENIKEEYAGEQRKRENVRINNLVKNSREGWIEALQEVTADGEYPELTYIDDEEHNKIVKPIIESAAQEYGKFVKLLGALGTKELPRDVARLLAKRFQLSQASALIAQSRADHYKRSEEIISESKRQASMVRPPVGTVAGGGSVQEPQRPLSAKDAAQMLINKVMNRK